MSDFIIKLLTTAASIVVGGLIGYVIAYVTGLRAMRKGMQLILRASLNDMYVRFKQNPPTADDKQIFEEMYKCYEQLGENGVMRVKHETVLAMPETVRK